MLFRSDLKPGNIMVTDQGQAKVLDFGLAKLSPWSDAGESQAETVASPKDLTRPGLALGTVAYMSPEQAQGLPVDHRSDIFTLGIILHEMATGERPFTGDTNVSIMSSIVKDTPRTVTEKKRNFPRHLGRIIKHALEKDVRRRYQAALDLKNDLEELKEEVESGEALPISAESPALARRRTGR